MKSGRAKFLLVLSSALLILAAGELVLRLTDFSYPNFYTYDEVTGSRLKAGAKGWYRDEGNAYIRINSAGLRDHEHGVAKPTDTIRIAILGDSYAEALQVPIEQTFWKHLQLDLAACDAFPKKKIEVVNFGVSGYSTAQELLTLQHYVWRYSPDVVLLAFLSGNDVRDNSREIAGPYPRPYFVLNGGEIVGDNSFTRSWIYKMKSSAAWSAAIGMVNHVKLLQLLNKAKNRLGQPLSAPQPGDAARNMRGEEIGLDDNIYFPPRTPSWENAWRVTEALLARMHQEVVAHGAQLLVVTLSNGIQVHPDPEVRRRFMDKLGVPDLFYPDERVRQFAQSYGIQVVTLAPVMQKFAEQNEMFLHGFPNTKMGAGHWNAAGHELAGWLVAKHYCGTKSP